MEDDGLNMRNWGYYEPSFKEHLGLQLMSPMADQRETKPYLSSRENPLLMNPNPPTYHQPPPPPMQYMRDGWIQRERLLQMLPGNPNFPAIPITSIPMVPPLDGGSGDGSGGSSGALAKKRTISNATAATPRAKKPKKTPSMPKQQTGRAKTVKRNMDVVINGIDMDISGIPIPVCSCTGASQQCYRWGSGGWQSACCTTTISMYPLPMSTKRRGARIAGRKMSQGAFKKVLTKLASEGYNFANAIDLKTYWAKHGTNKFVTIR